MPIIEKRYAQALLDLSQNDIYNIKKEFEEVTGIYNDNPDFRNFLLDPRIKLDIRQNMIRNVFSNILSKNMLNFILLLVAKQRISFLPQIFEQYVHLVNNRANVLEMKIITVQPLKESQLDSIKEKFKKLHNAVEVKITEIVDASIIGGIKVIVGDKVYDGSVKGRIESLTELVNK